MTKISKMAFEIDATSLARILRQVDNETEKPKVLDCRCFLAYNNSHIKYAVNAFYSKMMKRRLYDNKVCDKVLLSQFYHDTEASVKTDLIIYSDEKYKPSSAPRTYFASMKNELENEKEDSSTKLLSILQERLSSSKRFRRVLILREGFVDFREKFPDLCESSNVVRSLDLSQAEKLRPQCASLPNIPNGPTKILPFLYLGSEQDALDSSVLSKFNIQYIINISVNCPQPESVKQEGHFMRIPINDSYGEKLLPYFEDAFKFLDKVKEIGSTVLIHCLAGISRSPTLAIAYVMKKYRWPAERAYRFVKEKRPSVAPNFDFMGQLLDFEKQLEVQYGRLSDDNGECMLSSSAGSSKKTRFDEEEITKIPKFNASASTTHSDAVSANASWDCEIKREPSCKMNINRKRVMEAPSSLNTRAVISSNKSYGEFCHSRYIDQPTCLRLTKNWPSNPSSPLNSPTTQCRNDLSRLTFKQKPNKETCAVNQLFCCSSSSMSTPLRTGSISIENPNFQSFGLATPNHNCALESSTSQHYDYCRNSPSKSTLFSSTAETLRSSTLVSLAPASPLFNSPLVSHSARKPHSEHGCSPVSSESGFVDIDEYGKSVVQSQSSFSREADSYRDSDHESLGSATSQEISVI